MKYRILVIDDEESIRSSLRMILEHAGYIFSEAASGRDGLEKIAALNPDAVILDVKMPGMDGIDVLEELRSQNTDVPVIVVSGHGDIETAVKATKLGAWNFVEKPFGEERVLVEIRNAIEQRRLKVKADLLELEYDSQFEMIGDSEPMKRLQEVIMKASPTHATILITGESGTGKELVARAVHRNGNRGGAPFVRVNCAAIPEELIESELFGHERGSFTGATAKQIGKFLQADHGTLFLDEVGDMSLRTQAKVLRALETGEIEPVGAAKVITVDVRVIAATNKDLPREIQTGRFREDLYFRLKVIPIDCPALRDRREDIPLLIEHFSASSRRRFAPAAQDVLSRHEWKGNVRELKNTIERLLIMAPSSSESGDLIDIGNLPAELTGGPNRGLPAGSLEPLAGTHATLKDFKEAAEKEFLLMMLEKNGWNISRTAKAIDTPRSNLYKKLEQYGIGKDKVGSEETDEES